MCDGGFDRGGCEVRVSPGAAVDVDEAVRDRRIGVEAGKGVSGRSNDG